MRIMTQATIDAPIETVWRLFNDPEAILLWDASADWRTVAATNDLRVGGRLQLRIAPADGGPSFDHGVTYTRIEPPRRVAWRTDEGRLVEVAFEPAENGRIVVRQLFDADPALCPEAQRQDWQGVLDGFARHAAAHPPPGADAGRRGL